MRARIDAEDLRGALNLWIRRRVITTHHVSSACRMGRAGDDTAVVDQRGMVHGTQGLRIVDASIMLEVVRAKPNPTVIAMADTVIGDHRVDGSIC